MCHALLQGVCVVLLQGVSHARTTECASYSHHTGRRLAYIRVIVEVEDSRRTRTCVCVCVFVREFFEWVSVRE